MLDAAPAPLLEVENLGVALETKLGRFQVIDGVSFRLAANETLGVVGESGSGKSMTALSIMRVLPRRIARITSGRVLLNGEDLLQKSETQMRQEVRGRKIAIIPQDPQTSLNPLFPVGAQIVEALRMHMPDLSRDELRAQAIRAMEDVRIAAPEHRFSAYPHQLSGGMKQRIVGAIAIACRPSLIIADEPTTALDVTVQAQYLRLLEDLQAETGMGILFITHDLGIVAKLCDRLMVMYAGRVVETGTVRAIFDRPAHPYTRALLASVPRADSKAERLVSIEGQPPAFWDLPKGCRFAPRCPLADERCRTTYPSSSEIADGSSGHSAACWKTDLAEALA